MKPPTVKLADVAQINLRPSPSELAANPAAPIFRPESIQPELATAAPEARKRARGKGAGLRACYPGDILVPKARTDLQQCRIAQVGPETPFGLCDRTLCVAHVDSKQYHPRLLLHFLRQPKLREAAIRLLAAPGTPATLSLNFLSNMLLPWFPLKQQALFAEYLDTYLELRSTRMQASSMAAEDLRTLFDRMFDSTTHPLASWGMRILGAALETVEPGLEGPLAIPDESGQLAVAFRNLGLDGRLGGEYSRIRLAAPDSTAAKRALVQPGDVLVDLHSRGRRRAAVPHGTPALVAVGKVFRLAGKQFDPQWLAAWFGSPTAQAIISPPPFTEKALSPQSLRNLPLPCPPLALQQAFAAQLATIGQDMARMERQVLEEAAAYDSTAADVFDGKFAATTKNGEVHLVPRGKG